MAKFCRVSLNIKSCRNIAVTQLDRMDPWNTHWDSQDLKLLKLHEDAASWSGYSYYLHFQQRKTKHIVWECFQAQATGSQSSYRTQISLLL